MEALRRFTQQWKQLWLGMSLARRVGLAATTVVCVALIVAVGYWAAQPDWRVLYSNLSAEDAGAVTAKLQTQNVSFRLSGGGTTILVAAEQVQQLRLDLAADGLPSKGGKGFELFDDAPLGMTPFMQHINYGRALQTELAKSIMRLDPVAQARVHIVQPEPTPFVREQKPTTASVVLWLKPGTTLSRSMANGIVSLVSHSVEGLAPDQVTLLDNTGRVLSEQHAPESNAAAASQLEYQHELEKNLATKAEEMLARLLGPGRAVVRVTAEVNFKQLKEKKETYSPEDKVVRKETVTNFKSTGGSRATSGLTGFEGQKGKLPTAAAKDSGPNSQEESVESEYAISKTIQESEDRIGNIERLSVAAMVDLSRTDESGQAAPALSPKDAEEIIKQAVGFKDKRDSFKLSDVRLTDSSSLTGMDPELVQMQRWQTYLNLVRNASLGIASLVALFLGFAVVKRIRPLPGSQESAEQAADTKGTLDTLGTLAERNPEVAARLLATWLDESQPPIRKAA
jgi:flagellar M-ring protein FliF